LVQRCLGGDQDAFTALVLRYQKPVYNAAFACLGRVEDASDVAQIVFLRVFERLGDFDQDYRFFSWIYRIAMNESLNVLRRNGRDEPLGEDEEYEGPESAGPEWQASEAEASERIQGTLMRMKAADRAVITLRHFAELQLRGDRRDPRHRREDGQVAPVRGPGPHARAARRPASPPEREYSRHRPIDACGPRRRGDRRGERASSIASSLRTPRRARVSGPCKDLFQRLARVPAVAPAAGPHRAASQPSEPTFPKLASKWHRDESLTTRGQDNESTTRQSFAQAQHADRHRHRGRRRRGDRALRVRRPSSGSNVSGTVAPAERYRATQVKSDNVKLGDQTIALLLQDDKVDKLIKDPGFQKLAANQQAMAALAANAKAFHAMASQRRPSTPWPRTRRLSHRLASDTSAMSALADNAPARGRPSPRTPRRPRRWRAAPSAWPRWLAAQGAVQRWPRTRRPSMPWPRSRRRWPR
jgi:RNA polymerase sigma-70 factor (ECF subfamily)